MRIRRVIPHAQRKNKASKANWPKMQEQPSLPSQDHLFPSKNLFHRCSSQIFTFWPCSPPPPCVVGWLPADSVSSWGALPFLASAPTKIGEIFFRDWKLHKVISPPPFSLVPSLHLSPAPPTIELHQCLAFAEGYNFLQFLVSDVA